MDFDGTSADQIGEPAAASGGPLSAPVTWMLVALAGVIVLCAGAAVDVYRADHGTDVELVSFSDPGTLVALGGVVMIAGALLVAVSLLALRTAPSAATVVRRSALVLVAWVAVAAAIVAAVTYAATTGVTLRARTDAGQRANVASGTPAQQPTAAGTARVTLRGTLTLDGALFDSTTLGVVVIRDGLSGACQRDIPGVQQGRYEVAVLTDADVRGCGAAGARMVLWVFVGGQFVYSRESTPWPADGSRVAFDASFSTAAPAGASLQGTEFFGLVTNRDGSPAAGGTLIEAYIGQTLCGLGSVRKEGFTGYNLAVAGPYVSGCLLDAPIVFRVGGQPANETATNDIGRGAQSHTLNLTIK